MILHLRKNSRKTPPLGNYNISCARNVTTFPYSIVVPKKLHKRFQNNFEKVEKTTFLTPKMVENDP